MYRSSYDDLDDVKFAKRMVLWVVAVLVVLSAGGWVVARAVRTADTAVLRYEEFQEIYNTCQKLDTDLGTIRSVPDGDAMFANFSKAAMVTQKKQALSRWVEEYNAKSQMWNRALWKSSALPYQLTVNQFRNFQGDGR